MSIDKEQLKKIGRGAIIAAVGAALTYLLQAISGMNLGPWTPVATAVLSIAVNVFRKLPL